MLAAVDAGDPSPKFHEYVYGAVPPLTKLVKLTARGGAPLLGFAVAVTASGDGVGEGTGLGTGEGCGLGNVVGSGTGLGSGVGEGVGDVTGDGSGVGLGVTAGDGLGAWLPDGEGEGAAACGPDAAVPTNGTQLTPEPAKGSQAGAPPVIQTRVPGPRPNTKRPSKQAMNSPKMTVSERRSLPCIRVRSS